MSSPLFSVGVENKKVFGCNTDVSGGSAVILFTRADPLDDLQKPKPVKEEDYKGLVELVDKIESAQSQLDELNRLNILTMRNVGFISGVVI